MKYKIRLTPTVQKRKCTSVNLMEEGEKEKKKMNMGSSTCKLKFVGWRMRHHKDWESWATNMCFVHKSTWENAGIYEAVDNSTYIIKRQDDLILELASRWCSQTNTFVFPWGEATLTLEDMSVLGGFSSSGASALSSIENDPESLNIKEQLELARKEIVRTRAKTPLLSKWIEKFKDSSSDEVAHAAFLSLWLSRYVFPAKSVRSSIINKHVFPVAAQLSRGIELALGPAVLAMLYSDLSALSKRLRFNQLVDHSDDKVWQTNLCGLFHLVQIWAWERFPILQPVLEYMPVVPSSPRLARWSNVEILKGKDLKAALDSGEEAFLWRPYGSSSPSGQCMETVELVGFDSCIEKYQPRRVARQFGLDQGMGTEDVVGSVPPGFAPRVEAILIIDSDSDDDHDVQITPQAQIKREDCDEDDMDELELLQHSNLVCPDEEVEHMFFMDKTEASQTEASERASVQEDREEDGITNKDEFAPLQRSNLASTPSENESSEAMHVANGRVHETQEEEGDEVACAIHDEVQGMEAYNEPATSYEAENDMNEWLKDSGLDLEARISRLENIVYPAIKELEEAMQVRHH